MNALNKTLIAVALASLAAIAVTKARADEVAYAPATQARIEQCQRNAGATNPDEKAACIQVAIEDAASVVTFPAKSTNMVAACSINAGSANSVEREACIQVYLESELAKCDVAGSANYTERMACRQVVREDLGL